MDKVKKWLIVAVIGVILIMGNCNSTFSLESNYIEKLTELKIMNGDSNGNLNLDSNLTRAEMCTFVTRYLNQEALALQMKYKSSFKDVNSNDWYSGYINLLNGHGYVNGYGDGNFRPQKNVNAAEFITVWARVMGAELQGNNWPNDEMLFAREKGLLDGVEVNNLFLPLTRREAAKIIYNAVINTKVSKTNDSIRGIVVETSRVESIDKNQVIIEELKDESDAYYSEKTGREWSYFLEENERSEDYLGKIVELLFDGDKVIDVKIVEDEKYIIGEVETINSDKLIIDNHKYSLYKAERETEKYDSRIFQIYLDGKDITLDEIEKLELKDNISKATIKNGKVIFLDILQYDDVAVVSKIEGDKLYYYNDQGRGNEKRLRDADEMFYFDISKSGDLIGLDEKKYSEINVGDVIYLGDKTNLIYKKKLITGTLEGFSWKHLDDNEISIKLNGNDYKMDFSNLNGNRDPVYSLDGVEFQEFDSKYKKTLDKFESEFVEIILDFEDNIQLIKSNVIRKRKFGYIKDFLSNKLLFVDYNNALKEGNISFNTEIAKSDLERLNIEESDVIEGITLEDFVESFEKKTFFEFESKDDINIDRIVELNIENSWFKTSEFDDEFIDINEAKDNRAYQREFYRTDRSKVIVEKEDKIEIYSTVDKFFKKYTIKNGISVVASLLPFENDDRYAEFIIVKPNSSDIDENPIDLKTVYRKLKRIYKQDSEYYLDLINLEGEMISAKVASPQALQIVESDKLFEESVLELRVSDDKYEDIYEIKTIISGESDFVFKVLETDGEYLVLGFEQKPYVDADDFEEDQRIELKLTPDAKVFGELEDGEFVRVRFASRDRVDYISVLDDMPDRLSSINPLESEGNLELVYNSLRFGASYIYQLKFENIEYFLPITNIEVDGRNYEIILNEVLYVQSTEDEIEIELFSNDSYIDSINVEETNREETIEIQFGGK